MVTDRVPSRTKEPMYSRTVLEHFCNPRNVGELSEPDGYARVKSPLHNDLLDLYIQVEQGTIAAVKYRVQGCVAAIASASVMTEQYLTRGPYSGLSTRLL